MKVDIPEELPEPQEARFHPPYGLHLYQAKKPPNVVKKCIELFTRKGDVVLDPFVGCGVTAGEAVMLGRRAIATDLCPLSIFITETTLTPYTHEDLQSFQRTASRIISSLSDLEEALYRTKCKKCGRDAKAKEYSYDSTNDSEDPRYREWELKKVYCTCPKGHKEWQSTTSTDRSLFDSVRSRKVGSSYPKTRFLTNTRINIYEGMTVEDIFTRRNIIALASIRARITSLKQSRVRDLLRFSFSTIIHSSRMSHYKRANFQNFFIPKEDMRELNVFQEFSTAVSEIATERAQTIGPLQNVKRVDNFEDLAGGEGNLMITQLDATKLHEAVPDESIDYVHTDPPYVDQVPYMEVTLPYIAWLELCNEKEYKRKLDEEIILTNSPERREKSPNTSEGKENYRKLLGNSISQIKRVLKRDHWASVWFCSKNEQAWRSVSDNLKSIGLEDRVHHLVARNLKTFKVNIEKERNPLAEILEQDLLIHAINTGIVISPQTIPLNIALDTFGEVAVEQIRRKGYATTGEIYLAFVKRMFDKYGEPPPDIKYTDVLAKDKRFVAEDQKELVKGKYETMTAWRLKEQNNPARISSYLQTR